MAIATKPLRISMLGLRSFPGVQGGVETHAENLCPLLAQNGCDVEVFTRSAYHDHSLIEWRGVRFRPIWSPKSKALEAIVHSVLCVLYAGFISRPDVLHIQAIGPALVTPLARLMGLKVVVTHHGPDYDRQKWGRFAKWALRVGERFGMRCSHQRVVISSVIQKIVKTTHHRDSVLIPNGVKIPALPETAESLQKFGLLPGQYVLLVSRLVPEKRHLDLIEAFRQTNLPGWKLVLVGASDHPDAYTQSVVTQAKQGPNIICTGLQTGESLRQLYGHAGVFVLPSSHEGLPIALLEALSFGLRVIASDIPANLEVGLAKDCYYPLGDIHALARSIASSVELIRGSADREAQRAWVASHFDWTSIARQTLDVYKKLG